MQIEFISLKTEAEKCKI